ncbi:hypothetical protein [Crateriforma spongiae]|uniref:hypothetical protein n=1 Tax=Crateriforma spongiae TaxID=2724528 RepID=UPI00198157BB|nr:hypothetical protein [Crateriforma spongiae]
MPGILLQRFACLNRPASVCLVAIVIAGVVRGDSDVDPSRVPDSFEAVNENGGLKLAPVTATSPTPPMPGHWWPMPVLISNSAPKAKTAIVTVRLIGHGDVTYRLVRRIESGFTARDEVWVQLPDLAGGTHVNLSIALAEVVDGVEVPLKHDSQRAVQDLRLLLSEDIVATAVLAKLAPTPAEDWQWRLDQLDHEYNLMIACRELDQQSRLVLDLERLPRDFRRWDAIDNLFIHDASGLNDPHGVAVLRRWLADGGKAWVSLDRISVAAIAPLIGDLWQATDMGTVQRNDFDFRTKLRPDMDTHPLRVQRYHPMTLRKIHQSGGEVTHWIDDWPAAVRVRVGRGEVWLTMADASAWYEPYPPNYDIAYNPPYQPNAAAIPIVSLFQQPRNRQPPPSVSPTAAAIHVGYPVASRWAVLASLATFIVGGWCVTRYWARQGVAERSLWSLPLTAVIASAPLAIASMSMRKSVPDTLAHAQFAMLQPDRDQAILDQSSVLYFRDGGSMDRAVDDAESLRPFGGQSTQSPVVWTDMTHQRRLSIADWPTGLQSIGASLSVPAGSGQAIGRLTQRGLEIRLAEGLPGPGDDPAIVLPPARVHALVRDAEADDVWVLPADADAPQQFRLASGLLNQTQQSHQEAYRTLIRERDRTIFGDDETPRIAPLVLAWTPPWEQPMNDGVDARINGEALCAMSMRLLPASPGDQVRLPPSTIKVESVESGWGTSLTKIMADGESHAPEEDPMTWQLRWQIPRVVLPLDLTSAQFQMDIDAPMREVTLTMLDSDGKRKQIAKLDAPSGTVKIDVGAGDLVYHPGVGELRLEFDVSPAKRPPSNDGPEALPGNAVIGDDSAGEDDPAWQIRRPQWWLRGVVQDSGTRADPATRPKFGLEPKPADATSDDDR